VSIRNKNLCETRRLHASRVKQRRRVLMRTTADQRFRELRTEHLLGLWTQLQKHGWPSTGRPVW
jgi:hypothetical protein